MHNIVYARAQEGRQEDVLQRTELLLQHRKHNTEERGDAQDRKIPVRVEQWNKRYVHGQARTSAGQPTTISSGDNRVYVLDTMIKDRPLGA